MTTIVLCELDPKENDTSSTIHISSNDNISAILKKLDNSTVEEIRFEQCGLSRLFNGPTPVQEMWNEFHRILTKDGILIVSVMLKTLQNNNVSNSNDGNANKNNASNSNDTIDNNQSNINSPKTKVNQNDRLRSHIQTSDFNAVIQNINSRFFLSRLSDEYAYFRKISNLEPTIVTSLEITNALQKKKRVEDLFQLDVTRQVCKMLDNVRMSDKITLGSGKYGTVYYYPKWRSNVVVKVVPEIYPVILNHVYNLERPISLNGKREATTFLEIFSSALLNNLTTGESKFGHTIHIPRFEGFFTCVDNMTDSHSLYIIEEKLDTDFKGWIKDHAASNALGLKSLVWQCLYTLIMLVKMKWSHGDASTSNFLVANIEGDYYINHVNIGVARNWVHKLDGKEWNLRNVGVVAKISDFGFMQHFHDPQIKYFDNKFLDSHRIPMTTVTQGADVGYFLIMLGLAMYKLAPLAFEEMKPLYQDWFKLLDIKCSDHVKLFKRIRVKPEWKNFTLETSRLDASLERYDVSSLLDSSYFNDVLD